MANQRPIITLTTIRTKNFNPTNEILQTINAFASIIIRISSLVPIVLLYSLMSFHTPNY